MVKKKAEETEAVVEAPETEAAEETTVEAAAEEVAAETAVEAAPVAEETPAKKEAAPASDGEDGESKATKGKRAERIGLVTSDKMTKTVVVRVDRLVKHPIYRKYIRKRKKFMAHDETGAKIGDKVRIVETRPLSARKRWRVVEIIQKAEL
jgi:small subunit ribosomal protein S17